MIIKTFRELLSLIRWWLKNSLRRMGMPLTKWLLLETMDYRVIGVYKNKDTAIGAYGEIGTALVAYTQLAAENNTDAIGQIFSM